MEVVKVIRIFLGLVSLSGAIIFLMWLQGCSSSGTTARWSDMWTDISLRHQYDKYGCANCGRIDGYSKENRSPAESAKRKPKPAEPATVRNVTPSDGRVQELTSRVEALEDAMKTNAATVNQNQDAIVGQIKRINAVITPTQNQ